MIQKTPEEIKEALKCCSEIPPACNKCPYDIKGKIGCKGIAAVAALAYIEQLETVACNWEIEATLLKSRIPEWISVKENLPQDEEEVLVAYEHLAFRNIEIDEYNHKAKAWRGLPYNYKATHWMTLPELPKEE